MSLFRLFPLSLGVRSLASLLPAVLAFGREYTATDRQPTPAELATLPPVVPAKAAEYLKSVKVPADFKVTIFATPPAVNYPVFIAAATEGTLYVSSDGNGSLDRKPHLGRVLRVRDTNGDGQADEVRAFVPAVDSPRGLVWDQDRLYLLHPPDLSVYRDLDGDGVAEDKQVLVRGIGWTLKDRPADHGSNGLELGIDGWLYAAIGDFGFMEAVGTDGRKLPLRGGGVVRIRTDGSGIELWANGTRNIVEAAVSSELDAFTRDNTNDGGGWDIRFHHFSGFTQHGYPRLFKNFPDEIVQPLADYGGGSGCGAGWLEEPGIPAKWNHAPLTADWGRDWIYHHGLTPNGATFKVSQNEFIQLPRVTDLDVDGNSAIYAASWRGASFNWVGPEVGFIARVTPMGFQPEPLPNFEQLGERDLVRGLESASHRRRLAAQRAILKKGNPAATPQDETSRALEALAIDGQKLLGSRIAAILTLAQRHGVGAVPLLQRLSARSEIAPWTLRALGELPLLDPVVAANVATGLLRAADPRTRKEAIVALTRWGQVGSARPMTSLLADTDPIVAHTTVEGLIRMGAAEACLAVVNDAEATGALRAGALRVLQSLPEAKVVSALRTTLNQEKDAERRAGLLTALCRLHFVDGVWKGDSWGTRPDTRGPFYQPEPWSESATIARTLLSTLEQADVKEAAFLGRELARHRIPLGAALEQLIQRAATEPSLRPALAAQLAEAEQVPTTALPLLQATATDADTADAARAQAVMALAKSDRPDAWRAILQALPLVARTKTENNLAEAARRAVQNASGLEQVHGVFEAAAAELDGERSLIAEGLLLKLAARKVGAPEARAAANQSLDTGWREPKRRRQILRAAAQVGDATRAGQIVAALADPDPEVAKTASETVKRLKLDPEKFRADANAAKVGSLGVESVLNALLSTKGDLSRGEQLFTQVGCQGCHTTKSDEPLKGPFLGTIAQVYRRRELAESILVPGKTIAQGFVANHFELADGTELDAFVVREAADAVTVRTLTAQEVVVDLKKVVRREKQERSLMPEGLVAELSLREFASLVEFLESISAKK